MGGMHRTLAAAARLVVKGRPDRGATAVEYAIMASLIAAVIAVAVSLVAPPLKSIFIDMAGHL